MVVCLLRLYVCLLRLFVTQVVCLLRLFVYSDCLFTQVSKVARDGLRLNQGTLVAQ